MALKLPAKIFLFLQKMNFRTLYFKPMVAKTLVHTLYPTAIWDEVCRVLELNLDGLEHTTNYVLE